MKQLITALATTALLLTGCSAAPVKDATYKDVNQLAAAFEKAVDGVKCQRTDIDINTNDWVYVTCDDSDFAELFNSDAVRQEVIQKNPLKTGQERLEGSNWMIVAGQYKIQDAQKKLGGSITSS